jgi:Spy/CpxP family protein refolding chaperone
MKRSSLTIAFYLFLIFASGVLVGAFGYRLYSPPMTARAKPTPEEWRRQYLGEMQSRLNLTPDQLGKLNTILDETRTRFHKANEERDGIIKHIKQEQTDKVRTILTAAQRPEYEKLRTEREQRSKAEREGKR